MNAWTWLIAAILLEVCGTISLKLSEGFSKTLPSVLLTVFYASSFYCLATAIKNLEVGIAYAIWAALGTALVALIGILYFGESWSFLKILSLILIILGSIGLNIACK